MVRGKKTEEDAATNKVEDERSQLSLFGDVGIVYLPTRRREGGAAGMQRKDSVRSKNAQAVRRNSMGERESACVCGRKEHLRSKEGRGVQADSGCGTLE